MAKLDIAVEHGQTAEAARANFEKAIKAAQKQYGRWIHRVEWSPDREAADLSGPGFEVRLSFDDRKVYARGTVPVVAKLLEKPMKGFLARVLKKK